MGEAVPWACVRLLVLVPEKRVLGEKRQLVWQVYTRRGFGRENSKRGYPPQGPNCWVGLERKLKKF